MILNDNACDMERQRLLPFVDAASVGYDLPDGEGTSILEERGISWCSIKSAHIYRGQRLKAGAEVRHVPGNHQLRKRRH